MTGIVYRMDRNAQRTRSRSRDFFTTEHPKCMLSSLKMQSHTSKDQISKGLLWLEFFNGHDDDDVQTLLLI